jgi:hypothetical protein
MDEILLKGGGGRRNGGGGGTWAIVKKVFVVLSVASIGLNVWTLQRIRCKFLADLEEINTLGQETA